MISGMTASAKEKIAVTLDPHVLRQVRSAVAAGSARSVSSFVEQALWNHLAATAEFDALVDDMLDRTGGPPTEEERTAALRLLG